MQYKYTYIFDEDDLIQGLEVDKPISLDVAVGILCSVIRAIIRGAREMGEPDEAIRVRLPEALTQVVEQVLNDEENNTNARRVC